MWIRYNVLFNIPVNNTPGGYNATIPNRKTRLRDKISGPEFHSSHPISTFPDVIIHPKDWG